MPLDALALAAVSIVLPAGLTQRVHQLLRRPRDPLRRAVCGCLAGPLLATVTRLGSTPRPGWSSSATRSATSARWSPRTRAGSSSSTSATRPRVYLSLLGLAGTALFLFFPPAADQPSPDYAAVHVWYIALTLVSIFRLAIRLGLRLLATAAAPHGTDLHPLWHAVSEAVPEFTLMPPGTVRRPWSHKELGFPLYRQVIEIRDGQLAPRPYADPGAVTRACAPARAAGLPPEKVRAITDATARATTVTAKQAGHGRKRFPARRNGGSATAPEGPAAWRCYFDAGAHLRGDHPA